MLTMFKIRTPDVGQTSLNADSYLLVSLNGSVDDFTYGYNTELLQIHIAFNKKNNDSLGSQFRTCHDS